MNKLNMYKHNNPGFLFTFCGLDGSGKTTIINRVKSYLERMGCNVVLTKQPTSAVRQSDIFRTYMDTPDHDGFDYRALSLLAASDRIQHSNEYIMNELKQGKVVLSDRYFYACLANLRARGYTKDRWIYDVAKNIPEPDMAFFFDIEVEKAVKRVRMREEEKNRYIDMELQYKLRAEYRMISMLNNGVLISTDTEPEATSGRVIRSIEELFEGRHKCYGVR